MKKLTLYLLIAAAIAAAGLAVVVAKVKRERKESDTFPQSDGRL